MNEYKDKDEIIKERVLEVADYAIETKVSTRKIAEYFSKHRFKISNATVCVYLSQRLPKIDPERYKLVKPIIEKNKPQTIDSVEVRKRVYTATSLLLQGLTIPQIVEELNIEGTYATFDIIYDDLTTRLGRIEQDQKIINDVKKRLHENRIDTLNNHGINGPNLKARTQPRLENGRFTSNEEKGKQK